MVLILISWLYIFLTSTAVGIGISKLFSIEKANLLVTSLLGLFGVTLLGSVWAFFGPINFTFHLYLLAVTVVLLFRFTKDFSENTKKAFAHFTELPKLLQVLLFVISFLICVQSATFPFVIDNETYYVQTIKWLNEYGFVPGLANLHLFLGQTSGWHITQSIYSFSFVSDRFNDCNGYCLLLFTFWSFQKLHAYFKTKKQVDLIFGLLPLAYPLLFQFISAPSPDLALYLLAFLVFDCYLESAKAFSVSQFKVIVILILYAIFIKITAVFLVILPLVLLFKNYATLKRKISGLRLVTCFVFLLWTAKNIILTGYPLFPFTALPFPETTYCVPKNVMDYFFGPEMRHSFYIPFESFHEASFFDCLKWYFSTGTMESLIGVATIILVFIIPFVIRFYYQNKTLWPIYIMFVVSLVFLIYSSPQYRFYVYYTIFFGLMALAVFVKNKQVIIGLFVCTIFTLVYLVFIPTSFTNLTDNTTMRQSSSFDWENIWQPKPNSKTQSLYVMKSKENLKYNTPINYDFFWITGNGNLPCVTTEQLDYFETNFHYIPQLRSTNLRNGFYPKKTQQHD